MQPFFQREFRELGHVPRWQIARTIKKQNVAAHSFYVCLYTHRTIEMMAWPEDDINRVYALEWAIYHDVPEAGVGDVQSPTKRRIGNGALEALEHDFVRTRFGEGTPIGPKTRAAAAVVNFADKLEQAMFLAEELQLGNRTLGESLLTPAKGRDTICSMVMRHLKLAWDGVKDFNKSHETPDYQWRTYVIASIIENFDSMSYIIQDMPGDKSRLAT